MLRIDLGGVGDSITVDPPTENKPHAPIRLQELHDTVAWARAWSGLDQVVVTGVCSGAFNTFHAAVDAGMEADRIVLINPGIFYLGADQNPVNSDEHALSMAYTFTRSVTNPRRWKLALQDRKVLVGGMRNAGRVMRESTASGFRFLLATSARNAARKVGLRVKAPSVLARDLGHLIDRGMDVLLVFAAGESSAQYLRAFGGCDALLAAGGLQILEIDGGDHIFSPPGARQELTNLLTDYFEHAYAGPAALATDLDVPPNDATA